MSRRKTYLEKFREGEMARAKIRSDTTLTEARYEEIVSLRMLLLDVNDTLEANEQDFMEDFRWKSIKEKIDKQAKTWGKKGDCV